MRRFYLILKTALLFTALLLLPLTAHAIITDPDDYIIYDTGTLGDTTVAKAFSFTDPSGIVRFFTTENVSVGRFGTVGRNISSEEDLTDMGFPVGTSASSVKNSYMLSSIIIKQIEEAPYLYKALEWKKNQKGLTNEMKTAYRWFNNPAGELAGYDRFSDSLIIRIPATCDSIAIIGLGTNTSRGILAYQLDRGFENHLYAGGNTGFFVARLGFRPVVTEGQDSVDFVVCPVDKDWYCRYDKDQWSSSTENTQTLDISRTYTQEDGTVIPYYIKGERWGQLKSANILRIKVFGKIERGEVPPFEGCISGWTFQYRPKASGTVDLEDKLEGIDETLYLKYASDLGTVRTILTTDKEGVQFGFDDNAQKYVAALPNLGVTSYNVTDDSTQVINGEDTTYEHFDVYNLVQSDYLEMASKNAVGYQDLSIDFDFAIRDGADSLIVLAQAKGAGSWTEVGTFANTEDAWGEGLAHVSAVLPLTLNNKDFIIRLMPKPGQFTKDGVTSPLPDGEYAEGGTLIVSGLSINGYDDYHAKDDGAKKIAYISNCTDRLHTLDRATTADSTDAFLKRLVEGTTYQVKIFTQEDTKDLNSEEAVKAAFADYDMVILSEYPGSSAEVVKNAKYLIGYKPFLNLKAYAYKNWDLGATPTDGQSDSLSVVGSDYFIHPMFNGLGLTADNLTLPAMFNDPQGTKMFQGVTFTSEPGGYVIAKGVNSDAVSIYEEGEGKAKYMMVAISSTQNASLTSKCNTLLDNAMAYLLSSAKYEAPTFELTSDGAVVENSEELVSASAYNYTALGISTPVIAMRTSTDADGLYTVSGLKFGNSSIKFQPADSESAPVVTGSFAAPEGSKMSMSGITFSSLTFKGSAPAVVLRGGDKLSTLTADKCVFETPVVSLEGDSAVLGTVSVKNSTLSIPSSAVILPSTPASLSQADFTENAISGLSSPLVSWPGSQRASSITSVTVNVKHNYFSSEAPAAVELVSLAAVDSVCPKVTVDNNIFDNALTEGTLTVACDTAVIGSSHNLYIPSTSALSCDTFRLTLETLGMETLFTDGKISKGSPAYTAGTSRTYLGPISLYAPRTEPSVTVVRNVPELKTAFEIAYPGDVIELADYSLEGDTLDVYMLGNGGLSLPRLGGNLTVRAAEGASPKVFGRLNSSSASTIDTLLVQGLTWVDSTSFTGYDKDAYSPFYFAAANDTVNVLIVEDCEFHDQQSQIMLRVTKDASKSLYGSVIFRNNLYDNQGGTHGEGELGGHFVQLAADATYTLEHFSFTDNIVSNFHGSQLFNLPRSGSDGSGDISIDIEHNLFYKLGGNAKDQDRNFLEFNKAPAGCTVDINVSNNLIYERWSPNGKPVCLFALYSPSSDVTFSSVQIRNNYYEGEYYSGDETMGANPVGRTDSPDNLIITPEDAAFDVFIREKDLTADSLALMKVFHNEAEFIISDRSPLFTAGVDGTWIGPRRIYKYVDGMDNHEWRGNGLRVFSQAGTVYVGAEKAGRLDVLDMTGRRVASRSIAEGVNAVEGLQRGHIYILRVDGAAAKVLVK